MIAENRYIVTHVSPDWDAIGYAWLMQRFGGCESMYVRFVNTGRPDPDVLAGAYSVGDTGREYDPRRRPPAFAVQRYMILADLAARSPQGPRYLATTATQRTRTRTTSGGTIAGRIPASAVEPRCHLDNRSGPKPIAP